MRQAVLSAIHHIARVSACVGVTTAMDELEATTAMDELEATTAIELLCASTTEELELSTIAELAAVEETTGPTGLEVPEHPARMSNTIIRAIFFIFFSLPV